MTPRILNGDFLCVHCGYLVTASRLQCGVNNRNHCPYCLWSRHLDLFRAGDRLSACRASMRPIGLATKPGHNKYGPGDGELLLVHLCGDCGRFSLNRIASDDDAQSLMEIFIASSQLAGWIRELLKEKGIRLLTRAEGQVVHKQLSGMNAFHALV
jgi:hypothetical protein